MAAEEAEYELQQLVSSDEDTIQLNNESLTPPGSSVTKHHGSVTRTSRLHKSASDHSHRSTKLPSVEINTTEGSSVGSKVSRNTATVSSSTNTSVHGFHLSAGSHGGTSRIMDKPPRPPQPNLSKLHNKKDVMDVRQMEKALLNLLDDFHTGKLRAFGKNCSMEQMTAIHQQQEHLARLHFELGAQQELFSPLSEDGLRQGVENVRSLMDSLEQLSISIEKLHVINSNTDT